jgi:hypothetical protein
MSVKENTTNRNKFLSLGCRGLCVTYTLCFPGLAAAHVDAFPTVRRVSKSSSSGWGWGGTRKWTFYQRVDAVMDVVTFKQLQHTTLLNLV